MPPLGESAVEKIHLDHDYMIEMVRRIKASCTQSNKETDNCMACPSGERQVCQGNVEQLIRVFVEFTLKHNLVESLYMEKLVPKAHRQEHNQAHLDIAQQLKSIRVVFSEDGNCIAAIDGIDRILDILLNHIKEFDEPLEAYLLAAA